MNDDGLDNLKKGLYSRKGIRLKTPDRSRTQGSEHDDDAPTDWTYEEYKDTEPRQRKPERTPQRDPERKHMWMRIFWIGLAMIFLISAGVFVYRFVIGGFFSTNNVTITVDAPRTSGVGEAVSFGVEVSNDNQIPIRDAVLVAEFPEDTYAADESGEVLDRVRFDIGKIEAGGSAEEEFETFLFGQEGGEVEVRFMLEYNSEASSATLTNEESYDISIVSSPISLTVDPVYNEVQSGDEFEIDVEVASNTNTTLQDLVLTGEYPGGFSYRESNPAAIEGENTWNIGDIESGESETVTITGILEGQDEEERFFTFNVGAETDENPNQITRLFAKSRESIAISEPPLALRTEINKNRSRSVTVPAQDEVEVVINWENTLSEDIYNLVLEARFDDTFVEERSIQVDEGFYRSSDNTVLWDRTTGSDFGFVEAGEEGSVTFEFSTQNVADVRPSHLVSQFQIEASAQEEQSSTSPRSLQSEITREVRLASDLVVSQSLSYRGGPFTNTGPVPPRANEETTYTVTWNATASANDVEDTVVRAALPAYVEFIDAEDDSVSVNSLTNEVVWDVGDILSDDNFASRTEEVSFQVEFEASQSQVGGEPAVIREVRAEGIDGFSGERLNAGAEALETDDLVEPGAGSVVE